MKAMISQPMRDKTDEEIRAERRKAKSYLESLGYEVVDTYFDVKQETEELLKTDGVQNIPLYYLSQALAKMSECDAVYFVKGWELARGCRIEYQAAKVYGVECITGKE